jgi:succinate dehydrogenase / fumarate reductase cytochrome b subunit
MAVAGLGLCGFVFIHAAGNLFLFVGPDAYNKYGHAIITNPLIYVAEAGLVAMFLAHIVAGVAVSIRNRRARQQGYAVASDGEKKTALARRTMAVQGVILLVFTALHIFTFKYGPYYETTVDGVVMRDLFRLVNEVFQSMGYVVWYVVAMVALSAHLGHGLYSALQTLGLRHPQHFQKFAALSVLYGVAVAAAFVSQPLYMHFVYRG